MVGPRAPLVALLCLIAWLAPSASAQTGTHHCGDIQLVFLNPDLQPQKDGQIHAQGQFFAQFQAIGKNADQIKVFGFSFGPYTYDFDETSCTPPAWVTGAYLPNYRADSDPSDGFFIPIKTFLVPDGTYGAAVHAYDGNGKELARFWAKAVVDNCDTASTAAQEKCDTDAAQMKKHDKTAPWPMILPGDGKVLSGHKLTIEFGEALSSYTVYLNGQDITKELKPWDGRLWDGDYTPDYGPYGYGGALPHCTAGAAPAQQCEKYGPAFEWAGRDMLDSDVVRVEATDLAGNKGVKDMHIGSGITGGAVSDDLPKLEYSVDHLQALGEPGKSALFKFKITNKGGSDGHPFATSTGPKGWTVEWQPAHVVVPPGVTKDQELLVNVPANTTLGTYKVNATLTYLSGGSNVVLRQPLEVVVGHAPAASTGSATSTGTTKGSPDVGVVAGLLALGLGVAWRRRR